MENEKELMDAMFGEEEPILPEGWQEGDDLFPEDSQELLTDENEYGNPQSDDLITVRPDEEERKLDDDDAQQTAEAKPSRKLKLKVNHREEEIDFDALSDEELIAMAQKSRDYDRRVEADHRRRVREAYQSQTDVGTTDEVTSNPAGDVQQDPSSPMDEKSTARDYRAEVEQLKALYPDYGTLPDEVAKAVLRGVPVVTAYLAYRDRQSTQATEALKKENAALKQNAAAAAKAPVRGVTGGGATPGKSDPFAKGFDSVQW